MTSHELKLLDMGARLFARRVMAKAELREEQARQEQESRAEEFWREVNQSQDGVMAWPGRAVR